MIRYRFEEFLTEESSKKKCNELINNLLKSKSKSLLISPMKSGKTTFVFNKLNFQLRKKKIQLIFVSPKVTLLDQIKNRYEITKCYGEHGRAEIKNDLPVITTPDSIFKVIDMCKEIGKEFFIVYDEAHEFELSYNFRKKLIYPIKYYDHGLCRGLLCMTATPDNIILSVAWDNLFLIDIEKKFIQTPLTNLVTGLNSNPETIANYIINKHKEDPATKVIRINNKDTINKVSKILSAFLDCEIKTWYRSREKDNENGDLHLQHILDGSKLGNEIILTTSLVDVGVEIYSEIKPAIISFIDTNSSLIEEIQFVGRFREGVKEFNLILPNANFNEDSFKTYEEIQDRLYQKYNILSSIANEYDKEEKMIYKNLTITRDLNQLYTYEIDPFAVNSEVFEKYIKQFIINPGLLRKYLRNHLTFNSDVIRIVNIDQKQLNNNAAVDDMYKELKLEEEEQNESFKSKIKEFREKVNLLNDVQVKVLLCITQYLALLAIHEKELFKDIESEYEFYHSDEMKEYRKRYYELEDFTKNQCTKKQLLLNILDDKWYEIFKKQDEYIIANRKFNKGFPVDKTNKLEIKIYTIRNEIIKIKGKEIGIRLSSKFKNELLEECKKNKCFSKVTTKALEKHLCMIYNVSENIVSSIKLKHLI